MFTEEQLKVSKGQEMLGNPQALWLPALEVPCVSFQGKPVSVRSHTALQADSNVFICTASCYFWKLSQV